MDRLLQDQVSALLREKGELNVSQISMGVGRSNEPKAVIAELQNLSVHGVARVRVPNDDPLLVVWGLPVSL